MKKQAYGSHKREERQDSRKWVRLKKGVKAALCKKQAGFFVYNSSWARFTGRCPPEYMVSFIVMLREPLHEQEVHKRLDRAFGDLK